MKAPFGVIIPLRTLLSIPTPLSLSEHCHISNTWTTSRSGVSLVQASRYTICRPCHSRSIIGAGLYRVFNCNWVLRQDHISSSDSLDNSWKTKNRCSPKKAPLALYSSLSHSFTFSALIVVCIVLSLGVAARHKIYDNEYISQHTTLTSDEMSSQIPPGRVGNLTPDQVEKLRMMWQSIFQLEQMYSDSTLISDAHENPSSDDPDPLKKKGRFGMFRKKGSDKSGTSSTPVSDLSITEDDKYGQTRQFHDILAKESPEAIRATIWSMVKHDHPDALVLRFLRARKWDVEKALIMLVSTMSWRQNEMNVDDEIMTQGEAGALQDEKGQNDEAKILGHDFLAQMRMGKSFLHGIDKQGRPICVVRVRLHKQGAQCEKSLERYTVYLIETTRMALRPPIDTAVS